MTTGSNRPTDHVSQAIASWLTERYPDRLPARVEVVSRPSAGYSNETLVLSCTSGDRTERLVLRMPPLLPAYPDDALDTQAAVHEVLREAGLPVPRVHAVESRVEWLGARFLVMDFVAGHVPGQAPGLDRWITDLPEDQQRHIENGFLDALVGVHTLAPAERLADVLRSGVRADLEYWRAYVDWASDGDAAAALVDALAWCDATVPAVEPEAVLLWGDARLGNVIYDGDRNVVALLDWELASLGPPEMDLAWYLVLDRLTAKATGAAVPGFRDRDEFVADYESKLGRPVVDLRWHEIFALVRSVAVNDKLARLAHAVGAPHPGGFGDANPMLGYLTHRIERFA
ncbi:MAG: phosphotransferase family protein [Acidimicrobiia bacterium]